VRRERRLDLKQEGSQSGIKKKMKSVPHKDERIRVAGGPRISDAVLSKTEKTKGFQNFQKQQARKQHKFHTVTIKAGGASKQLTTMGRLSIWPVKRASAPTKARKAHEAVAPRNGSFRRKRAEFNKPQNSRGVSAIL